MDTAKATLYNLLTSNLPYAVSQGSQAVFNQLPAVTFTIANNVPSVNLNREIVSQALEVQIDIWAETSTEASNALLTIEALMRANDYQMTFNQDVPNNASELKHIVTRFAIALC